MFNSKLKIMIVRTFINTIIIFVGPIVTLLLSKKNGSIQHRSFYLVLLIFSIITIVVAIKLYFSRKTSKRSVIRSTLYSMVIYVIFTCGYVFFFDPPGIAWLVIVIPVMIVVTFPMAFLISLGTIRILEDMKIHKD